MKLLSLSVAAIVSASLLHAAEPRYETLLPADTAIFYKVNSTSKLRQQLDGHPVGELFTNETIVEFLRPIIDTSAGDGQTFEESFEEETGLTVEEFLELFPGQFAIGISLQPMLDAVRNGQEVDSADPWLFVLAEHSGDTDKMDKLLEKLSEPDEGKKAPTILKETFLDETIHVVEFDSTSVEDEDAPDSLAYAVVGNAFVITLDVPEMKDVIARIKGESSGSSLAGTEIGARIDGESPAQIVINGAPLVAFIEEAIREGQASVAPEDRNPMMPTADAIIRALELSSFKGYVLSMQIEPDVIRIPGYLDVDLDRGLARLLNAYRNDIPRPRLVPDHAVSVQSMSFDIAAAWGVVEQTIANASPMAAGMYQGYLGQIEQQIGVNLRNAIIGNLGPSMTFFQVRRPEATDLGLESMPYASVFALGVKDRQGLESALEVIKSMSGTTAFFQQREYLGNQINVMGAEGGPQGGYVITDEWLIFSNSLPVLQQSLALAQAGGKTVWETERLQDAAKRLPEGGVAFDFRAMGPLMQMLLQSAAQGFESVVLNKQASGEDPDAEVPEFDYSLLKKIADLPFYSVSKNFKTADGIEGEWIIFKDESEDAE